MSEYSAYPLAWPLGWPRSKFSVRSRFGTYYKKPTLAQARDLILHELKVMNVGDFNVVISTNIPLRRDGYPYSNQREPNDTGAAVYWRQGDKRLVLACDKYNTVGDNLWAIGKTIEAQRGIERWGSVTAEQAFAGYARLQEQTQPKWFEILGIPEGTLLPRSNAEKIIMAAYREKAKEAHPDAGGSPEAFAAVVQAKDTALQLIK